MKVDPRDDSVENLELVVGTQLRTGQNGDDPVKRQIDEMTVSDDQITRYIYYDNLNC